MFPWVKGQVPFLYNTLPLNGWTEFNNLYYEDSVTRTLWLEIWPRSPALQVTDISVSPFKWCLWRCEHCSMTFIKCGLWFDFLATPNNIITSNDLNVTAPTELTLNCSADGKPKPTTTWTRLCDNTVVSMPLNITGGNDKGNYRCIADNGVGEPLTKDVFVDVQGE